MAYKTMKRYITGCLAGWALWLALVGIHYIHAVMARSIPTMVRDAVNLVAAWIGLAAWPLGYGGWLAWGEGPHLNPAANIAVSMILWGTLGVIAAGLIHRRRVRGGAESVHFGRTL
jgi:hypothetical protein